MTNHSSTRGWLLILGFVLLGTVVLVVALQGRLSQQVSSRNVDANQQPTVERRNGQDETSAETGRNLLGGESEDILEGGEGDDTLDGGGGEDWLFGKEGSDRLRGGAGPDMLDGGAGDDTLEGGEDSDILDGGAGADILIGGGANDIIDGGDDEDILIGGAGDDDLDGGDGDDILLGGDGNDSFVGGDGNDTLIGGEGADRLFGRDGDDTLSGGPGDDVLDGGDDEDTLRGEAGNDSLDGGDGDDVLRGGVGNDRLFGRDGADVLFGGPGDDALEGGDGEDTLRGEAGNDSLDGGNGDDNLDGGDPYNTLLGGDGRDSLTGGPGDDWLLGGRGADRLMAGTGNDLIVLRAGDVGSDENESIDAAAGNDVLILNGFVEADLPELPEVPPRPNESSPSAGIEFALSDPLTSGTYRVLNVEQIQHLHLFTQVGTSENEAASFLFINPSATAASAGSIGFVADDGTALALSIRGEPAQRSFEFTVPPLGSVEFDAIGPEGVVTGSAQLLVDNPLGGVVRTILPDLGSAHVAEAKLVNSFIVPVLEEEATAVSTGVVVFNSTVESTLRLTLYSSEGNERRERGDGPVEEGEGAVEIDVPAHGNRTLFVRDVFANVGDFQGTMTIAQPQQSGSVAATGIQRGAGPGEFTTFPTIPVAPLAAAETLQFARFSSGGDSTSSLVLVNPSPTDRAQGTLAFFDEEGEAWPVSVNGLAPAASIPYDVAPRGSVTFTTSADGSLEIGSAQATTAEGVLGGVLRWTSPAGTVNTGHSRALAGFITPAMRNSETGLNTELALSSTGSALTLSLTLRDAAGTEIVAGTTQLQLPANGQVIRTIDELFPNADTGDFTGTLTATAEEGTMAAMVTLSGGEGAVAVLPVMPLR